MAGSRNTRFDDIGFDDVFQEFSNSGAAHFIDQNGQDFLSKLKTFIGHFYKEITTIKRQRELNGVIAAASTVIIMAVLSKVL